MNLKNIKLVESLIDNRNELLNFKTAYAEFYSNRGPLCAEIDINGIVLKYEPVVEILLKVIEEKVDEQIKEIEDYLISL